LSDQLLTSTLNTGADGSLYLTILDLIKWDAALTNEKILNPEDLQLMFTPVKLNNDSLHPYGFGWYLEPVNGHKTNYHSGSWRGYNSYIIRFPDDKLSVIGLANLSPSNIALIVRDVAALYIPELSRPKVASIKDNNPSLTSVVTLMFKTPDDTTLASPLIGKQS
jgi:CubicO group peptidase (beta-lactamase class C family)